MRMMRLRSIIHIAIVLTGGLAVASFAMPQRTFEVAARSMEPTFPLGTVVTATAVTPEAVKRGDVLIVQRRQGDVFMMRLVGIPGDTVAMQGGLVVLNGEIVPQEPAGSWATDFGGRQQRAAIFTEQLPGEALPHRILDLGPSRLDDTPVITLPADRYFFLGDNRDNSLDSRFDDGFSGVGIVSSSQILMRVDMEPTGD